MKIRIEHYTLAALFCALAPAASSQTLDGMWDATITYNGTQIPFKMGLAGTGATVKGWFYNGEDREISNAGKFENGKLVLNFDSYLAKLTATVKDGVIDGEYGPILKKMSPVHAVRERAAEPPGTGSVPKIAGQWDLEGVASSKGEKTWRLLLRQEGAGISGAILRVDGDTGTLTGSYKDGKFVLSHFSGSRPALMIIKPESDGSLDVSLSALHGFNEMKAVRPEVARAKGLPAPADADTHTSVKDPNAGFPFSFPDLSGKMIANTDPRFKGKVMVVNVTGSWCPNCHDEAPFLAQMYDRYHAQGLEVVALNFEEADQLQDPTRLRAFIAEYGIHYTVLLCGETESAKEKLTQAVNWDAWPTTFFVGRDGRVKAVHAGFPSPGSGELYTQAKDQFTSTVEKLLAEK
jgi:thiol-disulfide isomerase/thioredoxin